MKHRTDYPEIDYRTEKQWLKHKLVPIDGVVPTRLWSNPYHAIVCDYYTVDQVRNMTKMELEHYRSACHKRSQSIKQRKESREQERYRQTLGNVSTQARYEKGRELGKELLRLAQYIPAVPCETPSRMIVFDTETTGLNPQHDEILQISIIDGHGNKLLDEFVRPYWSAEWEKAQEIHGITPDMVKKAPYPHELIPKLKGIFATASQQIAYNNSFDASFLKKWGIDMDEEKQIDVMRLFAPIYGEWNEYFKDYKWQTLSTCAAYYGYEFKAHDSLEDARATLFCYQKIKRNLSEI